MILCMHITVSAQQSKVNQQQCHRPPRPHLNQQTQCHTKDSRFYLYFFIRYRHNHSNRRETAARGRKKSHKQRRFTFVRFLPASRSPSFTISFSIYKTRKSSFPLFPLLLFPFTPEFKRGGFKRAG